MVAVSNASDHIDCIVVSPSDVEDGSSTASTGSYIDYGQVRLYPDGQVRVYHESRENSEVDAESEEDSEDEEEEEPQTEEEVVVCEMCGQIQCDWESFGEEI
jgi:hypothetical protein